MQQQCTFCDSAADNSVSLCDEHMRLLEYQGSTAAPPSPPLAPSVVIPASPALLRFRHGEGNAFTVVTTGWVGVEVASALTGAQAGHVLTAPGHGCTMVEYTVASPYVHRITVQVTVDGAPTASFNISDSVHFSGRLTGQRVFAADAFVAAATPRIMAVSPDGQAGVLAATDSDQWLLFNPQTEEAPLVLSLLPAAFVCWSAYRTLLIVCADSSTVIEMDLHGDSLRILDYGIPLGAVAASPCLVAAACASDDERVRRIRFVDYFTGDVTHAWGNWGRDHPGYLEHVAAMKFLPDGGRMAVTGSHLGVYLYEVCDGKFLRTIGPPQLLADLEVINGGRTVVACYGNRIVTASVLTGEVCDEVTCPGDVANVTHLAQAVYGLLAYDTLSGNAFMFC